MKFSVVIATHKRANLLIRAIESIQSQELPPGITIQIVVISDVQDEETDEVCHGYLRVNDIYQVRDGDAGPAESRNLGVSLARGDYVIFLDDDDAFHKDFIKLLSSYDEVKNNELVYFDCIRALENRSAGLNNIIEYHPNDLMGKLDDSIYLYGSIPVCCFAIPIGLAKQVKFEKCMKTFEDWEYFLQLYKIQVAKHVRCFGVKIFWDQSNKESHRFFSAESQGISALLETIFVYKKHPAKNEELKYQRSESLKSIGLDIPINLL